MVEGGLNRRMSAELRRELDERTRALEESEARYRAIFHSTLTFTGVTTVDGVVVDANRTALEALQENIDEVRGKAIWECSAFTRTPAEAEKLKRIFQEHRGEFVRYPLTLTFRERTPRTLEFSIRPVPPFNGGDTELMILEARDMTELRRAEERVRHAERMEALGKLTGGVAHDFNNLLTVVVGALDVAVRRPEQPNRERLLQVALEAARRGETLTRQLLAFARRKPVDETSVDIGGALRGIESLLHNALGEAIEIEIHAQNSPIFVRMDAAQFETAILNLAVNARDVMPSGGRLTIEAHPATRAQVTRAGLPKGDYVSITVTDTGQGIAREALPHIFEPFFTTKDASQGTGLGLSQVYGFAREAQGSVDVVSVHGRGSTFRLLLPLTRAEPSAVAERTPARARLGVHHVLLVEDDPGVAQVTKAMLADLGLRVRLAANGAEAKAIMRAHSFDLLMTDVVMPGGVSGVDLADWAARAAPGTRVLLCSGWADDTLLHHLRANAWPLIQKPFDTQALREAISRLAAGQGERQPA
jgi:PAS domain S-box-containing protein